jgi:hypothetical protein
MKKFLISLILFILFTFINENTYAWGKTGHNIVAQIAYKLMDSAARKKVQSYLGNLSFEEAANWMDDSRGNTYYNYMRTWHYLDIDKGEQYVPSPERNILTVLHSAITDLKDYNALKNKEVKRDILLIFHLVGDLHQPLHTGYNVDKGGNTIDVRSPFLSGNLHSVWDTQILEYKNINADSCMNLYATYNKETILDIQTINELKWMYQSRAHLDQVYDFKDGNLDKKYIDYNTVLIKKQLLSAGMRLAAIFNKVFATA